MAKAPYIRVGRLRHLLKVVAVSGKSPILNVVLLTTTCSISMMLTEIARLSMCTYPDRSRVVVAGRADELHSI